MDPLNRRRLINWLRSSDKTILLCKNDLDIALDVCSRCLVLVDGVIVADGPAQDILYDRALLEAYNLELPLALMTHELLHEKLRAGQMDDEPRRIIETILHAHRHAHGPDQHEHVHLHLHPHDHGHLHAHSHEQHIHAMDYDAHLHGAGGGDAAIPTKLVPLTKKNFFVVRSGEVSDVCVGCVFLFLFC